MKIQLKLQKLKLLVSTLVITIIMSVITVSAYASSGTATVIARSLNVRKGPGTSYSIVSSVSEGKKVSILSTSGSWSKITYSGVTGYVSSNYLKKSSTTTTASSTTTILKNGSYGSSVTTLQNNLKKLGYFKAASTGRYGSMTESAVRAFQKAKGLSADGIAGQTTLNKIKSCLSSGSTKTTTTTKIIGKTNITLQMGSKGSNVTTLQKALKALGYFKVSPTGTFGSITRSAVIAYQRDNGLSRDGVAGPKTLTAIYGSKSVALSISKSSSSDDDSDSDSSDKNVEMPDWWSTASKVFARGDTATITDVRTGKTFKVKRYGGTNHADSEPLTASDTSKMKSIYGAWSWSRRAVYVQIDGRRFAASMNGMPHGGQSLSYNNFSGHFCIHFLNSKTHGSSNVDPDHQAAVRYAYAQGNK